jgi:hypothetical protein
MSCEQAREIDAERFLLEAGTVEFESFRAHFPTCETCAAAVTEWTAFDLALLEVLDEDRRGRMNHPTPDRLELFASTRATLGEEATTIDRHLEICAACRTELAVLARYESEFLPAVEIDSVEGSRATERVGGFDGVRDWLRGLIEASTFDLGFGLQTAAAFSIVLLGLWWSGVFGDSETPGTPTAAPRLAQTQTQTAPTLDGTASPGLAANSELEIPTIDDPAESIALEEAPPPERPDPVPDASRIAMADVPSDPDPRAVPAPVPSQEPRPANAPEITQSDMPSIARALAPALTVDEGGPAIDAEDAPRDEVLLAALTDLPLPDYNAPAGVESLGWMHQFGAVRAGSNAVTIEIRAPVNHAGLTLSAAPRLWWSLSGGTDLAVQVTVVDDRELDPVLRVDLPGAFTKGLHSIDLAAHGVELQPDVEYRWFVSLVVDADRPSRNPVAAGALRRVADSDPRREIVDQALPTERGHTFARLGLWYDAFDFFASIAAAHPDFEPVARHRERLVELARTKR